MVNALWITLIGMSLVFVAILLLWGVMVLLVRLTAPREDPPAPGVEVSINLAAQAGPSMIPQASQEHDRKRRAAAAAVAAAMALQRLPQPANHPLARAGALSAWQAVHRAGWLSGRAAATRKKGNR